MPRRARNKNKSHQEIIKKRNEKKNNKIKPGIFLKINKQTKEYHLKEYLRLSSLEHLSEKDGAMQIMEIIEDIKDMGINDKRYKDVMDLLMNIHNEKETNLLTQIQTGGDYIPYDNTFVPTYGHRGVGHRGVGHYQRTRSSIIQTANILAPAEYHEDRIPRYLATAEYQGGRIPINGPDDDVD